MSQQQHQSANSAYYNTTSQFSSHVKQQQQTTPTKYSNNNSYSQQQDSDATTNGLYRSNSSTSLHMTNTNNSNTPMAPKTPIHNTSQSSQLNTSQSPHQMHSMSLCSTPTPSTPQPYQAVATSPDRTSISRSNSKTNIFPLQPQQQHVVQQRQSLMSSSSMAYTNNTTNAFNHAFNPSADLAFNSTSQYNSQQQQQSHYKPLQHQQHQQPQQQQHHHQHQPQQTHLLQQQQQQQPYMPAHYSHSYYQPSQPIHTPPVVPSLPTPSYLSNLLPPAYTQSMPSLAEPVASKPTSKTKPTTTAVADKPAKIDKTTSSSKASSKKSTKTPIHQTLNQHQHDTYSSQMAMSVNAATALHAAANWYDFSKSAASSEAAAIASLSNFFHKQQQTDTGIAGHRAYQPLGHTSSANSSQPADQFAPVPPHQAGQYNSQFQQSSLNSLFASSTTAPIPPKKDPVQAASRLNSSGYNLTGQYPNSAAGNSSSSYGKAAVGQSMPRSTSSNSVNEAAGYGLAGNGQHQQMHGSAYQYGSGYQMTPSAHQHYQGMNQGPGVQGVGHQSGQLSSYGGQFSQHNQNHQHGHHHPLGQTANSVLGFPHHHHHHQAAAMNSLLANQFSNVAPFNWHPKI